MGTDRGPVIQIFLLGVTTASALYKTGETHCSSPDIANAFIRQYDVFENVVEVECNPGYKLQGSSKLYCRNGKWQQQQFPVCVQQQKVPMCPTPAFQHASVHLDGAAMIADIKCNVGYTIKMNGVSLSHLKLYCGQNKLWVTRDQYSNIPDCTSDLLCKEPPKIRYASEIAPRWRPYREGTTVTYKCDPGYQSITYSTYYKPLFQLRCHDGKWTGTTPTCVKMYGCSQPHDLPKGNWEVVGFPIDALESSREKFPVRTKIRYSCIAGMTLLGYDVIECMPDYMWSHNAPVCIESDKCVTPDFSNGVCRCHGNTKYCRDFTVGEKVTCSCDDGYQLHGDSVVTCTGHGHFDKEAPYCINAQASTSVKDLQTTDKPLGDGNVHMNTLAIVIATACSVLGVLLLVMVVMVFRRKKPRTRLYHQVGAPPPYSRVHSNTIDEHDRVALIDAATRLPSYEEAVRTRGFITTGRHSRDPTEDRVSTTDYRPLPNIPANLRSTSESSNRHSIGTVSTVNRDGMYEVFGSIDTVNVSMSDASTSVTVDTLDSGASRPSNASGRATAGSLDSSRENLSNEDAPLLDNRNEEETVSEDIEIRLDEENKDT